MPDSEKDVVQETLASLNPTLQELADELGVSYASVRAWSSGRRTPRKKNVARLAALARRQAVRLMKLARTLEGGQVAARDPLGRRPELIEEHRKLTEYGWELVQELRRTLERSGREIRRQRGRASRGGWTRDVGE